MLEKILMAFTKEIKDVLYKEGLSRPFEKCYLGDAFNALKECVKEIAPFSTVVIIASEQKYQKIAKTVFSEIKQVGVKPLGVTFNGEKMTSIEKLSQLFLIPDDVRAVITFENELRFAADYLATNRKIPHIAVITPPCVSGIFSPSNLIKNGDKIERVSVNAERHLIIDDYAKIEKSDLAKTYLEIMSAIPTLLDYRLIYDNQAVVDIVEKEIEVVYKSAINSKNAVKLLFYSALKIELANYISDGELKDNGAFLKLKAVARRLEEKGENYSDIALFNALLERYLNDLTKKPADIFENYFSLAKDFSKTFSVNRGQTLSETLFRIKHARKNKGRISAKIFDFYKGFHGSEVALKRINKTYFALLGENEIESPKNNEKSKANSINLLIKMAKYYPFGFNGLSLTE